MPCFQPLSTRSGSRIEGVSVSGLMSASFWPPVPLRWMFAMETGSAASEEYFLDGEVDQVDEGGSDASNGISDYYTSMYRWMMSIFHL